jgi:hypothetical protein
LYRRRVFRALVGYGIAAFALLQIIEPVMHGLHWPDAVLSYTVVALALGFPLVVTLAWIFDVREAGSSGRAPLRAACAAPGSRRCSPESGSSQQRPASSTTSSSAARPSRAPPEPLPRSPCSPSST